MRKLRQRKTASRRRRISLGMILRRIRLGIVYSVVATLLAHVLCVERVWHISSTDAQIFLGTLILTAVVGPNRWLLAWLWAPMLFAYSWVWYSLLTKRQDVGSVPIVANDYWLLVSYGSIVGGLLAWISGQYGNTPYSLAIVGLCVVLWTLAAMMLLSLAPSRLYRRKPSRAVSPLHDGGTPEVVYEGIPAMSSYDTIGSELFALDMQPGVPAPTPFFTSLCNPDNAGATSEPPPKAVVDEQPPAAPLDVPQIRWASAFPMPRNAADPTMTRAADGSFRVNDDVPLRPPPP